MELGVLLLFCFALLFCIVTGLSILYALTVGLFLFLLYGKQKGYRWRELVFMALSGVKTVKNILITFVLIGMLTALWRGAGTVAVIVCYAVRLIQPALFLMMTFLLNSLLSVLTGTAFGTAATMGVICMTMSHALQIPSIFTGGAILAGAYFGDRCSPVSTSALLVSELTKTDIFGNIRNMIRSAGIPFLFACGFYLVSGILIGYEGKIPNLWELFKEEFHLSPMAFLPAIVLLILAIKKVNVKLVMLASIFTAILVCVWVQKIPVTEIPALLWKGFQTKEEQMAMMNGGGVLSMVRVGLIVCLSSSYSGLFRGTGLLDNIRKKIEGFAAKSTSYAVILVTAIVTGIVACNQTLTIMLTHQLCKDVEKDSEKMALDLEDSAVVIAPLIPWSIAGAVPLTSVGAPVSSVLTACFLYMLPMWRLWIDRKKSRTE